MGIEAENRAVGVRMVNPAQTGFQRRNPKPMGAVRVECGDASFRRAGYRFETVAAKTEQTARAGEPDPDLSRRRF